MEGVVFVVSLNTPLLRPWRMVAVARTPDCGSYYDSDRRDNSPALADADVIDGLRDITTLEKGS